MKREAIVGGLLGAACLLGAEGLEAQDPRMNFFVMPVGSQVNGPPVRVSDNHCQTEAYAIGFGSDLRWRAYMTGRAEDGEGNQVARDRIGSGPWYNYYGAMIAENLAQLHSDESNLDPSTAITLTGDFVPRELLTVPAGSALDGRSFSGKGAYSCFGVPG